MSTEAPAVEAMTPRQRWLAALDSQPVDRLPFWPKLGGNYPTAQTGPFSDMSHAELHQWFGSEEHCGVGGCVTVDHDRWEVEHRQEDVAGKQVVHRTWCRGGSVEMTAIDGFDPGAQAWHPIEFPVKTRDDIDRMTDFYAAAAVRLDEQALAAAVERCRQVGESASTHAGAGTSPWMDWLQHLAGIENAHFFLADFADRVETLLEAMHAMTLQAVGLTAEHHPADCLYLVENTSSTLMSPQQYQRYNLPHLLAYAGALAAHNRRLVLHMCGHLKALLPLIAQVPAAAWEAFTSPTLGTTTLLDGRTAREDICLIGGTGAPLWLRSTEEIIATIRHDLDELPHHRGIVITSAGVMPPAASPEKIRAVAEFVHGYPVRL